MGVYISMYLYICVCYVIVVQDLPEHGVTVVFVKLGETEMEVCL